MKTMKQLQADARVLAQLRGITFEQAFAQLLDENPQVYESYRASHNARDILRTLRSAGIAV